MINSSNPPDNTNHIENGFSPESIRPLLKATPIKYIDIPEKEVDEINRSRICKKSYNFERLCWIYVSAQYQTLNIQVAQVGPVQLRQTLSTIQEICETFLERFRLFEDVRRHLSKVDFLTVQLAHTVGVGHSAGDRRDMTNADVLYPFGTPVTTSSGDDDDEDRSDNLPQNENKRFKRVLAEISLRAKKNPNPNGRSFSRTPPIAQKVVEITSSPYKSQLDQI
ncbi:hypothetical protein FQA39_LY10919 [Lamprigera yunnana]|nr:hypothetical protein FQA39_LY10919 [Lamprigera yunnana]